MPSFPLHPDAPLGATVPGRYLQAQVDLGRLAANARRLQAAAKGLGLLAVVKADAYGHGGVACVRALEAIGVEGFCVASLDEALELRHGGITSPIHIFGAVRADALPIASAHRLDLSVVSTEQLRELAPRLKAHPVGLQLEIDTGMGRSGLLPVDLGPALDLLREVAPWIKGVMGHFATADEDNLAFTRRQRQRFLEARAQLADAGIAPAMVHHANTAGCLRGYTEGDTHVRCGIGLYGLTDLPEAAGLQPILELQAEVVRCVPIPAGTPVGYGATYTTLNPVQLATLACGYADGYPRALANRAVVGWRGATYPVVGRISMDSLTVALPADRAAAPGEPMTLFSREAGDPHAVVALARILGTIPYEVTCDLHWRVKRTHH